MSSAAVLLGTFRVNIWCPREIVTNSYEFCKRLIKPVISSVSKLYLPEIGLFVTGRNWISDTLRVLYWYLTEVNLLLDIICVHSQKNLHVAIFERWKFRPKPICWHCLVRTFALCTYFWTLLIFWGILRNLSRNEHSSMLGAFFNQTVLIIFFISTKTYVVVLIRSALVRHF